MPVCCSCGDFQYITQSENFRCTFEGRQGPDAWPRAESSSLQRPSGECNKPQHGVCSANELTIVHNTSCTATTVARRSSFDLAASARAARPAISAFARLLRAPPTLHGSARAGWRRRWFAQGQPTQSEAVELTDATLLSMLQLRAP